MTTLVKLTDSIKFKIYTRIKQSPLPGEILRFGLVGGAATIVHASVGFFLASALEVSISIANTLGFLAAWSVSYLGHSRLSFKDHGQGQKAFYRFIIHSIAMFTIATIVAHFTQKNLNIAENWIPVIAAVTIPALSLLSTKLFVFRKFKI